MSEAVEDGAAVSREELSRLRERLHALELEVERRGERQAALEQEAQQQRGIAAVLTEANAELEARTLELEEARRRAEAAASAKSSFLATVSHEIRTPMTAILGFAELLQDLQERCQGEEAGGPGFEEESRRHLTMIRTCGAQLLNLINDVLDMSKIEKRSMTLQHSRISIVDLLSEVRGVMQAAAVEKQLSLEVRYLTPVPERLHSDKQALTRVLLNLVGNAMKFTEQGGVTIELEFVRAAEGDAALHFSVVDTGIGIAHEHLASLFQPFFQIEGAAARQAAGTGLGLTISRELVRLLGGEIRVDSTPGKGSAFRFSIPCATQDAATLIRPAEQPLLFPASSGSGVLLTGSELPYRILVAEDVETNRMLIERILKKAGAAVVMTKNGGAAVASALEAMRAGRPFDVVLMDMVMPVLSGYEAVRVLRREGYRGPVLALTASAMGSDRARCLDAGCDGYLTKPINRGELVAVIRRHVEGTRGPAAAHMGAAA